MSPASCAQVWGYARSSGSRPLGPQVQVLTAAGVPPARLLVEDDPIRRRRPKLERFRDEVAVGAIPAGSVLVVETLDRLGLTVREMALLVRQLHEHDVGARTLADIVDVDTTSPLSPSGAAVLALLALVEQAEATYRSERVDVARAAATRDGRRLGRSRQIDPDAVAQALRLYDEGIPAPLLSNADHALHRLAPAERRPEVPHATVVGSGSRGGGLAGS